jgi:Sec-independent protein translocase protein TatA
MGLDPLELGTIAVMGVAIFIWGPEKIPEIAKTIGSARRQLDAATKDIQGLTRDLQNGFSGTSLDSLAGVIAGNPTPEEVAQATTGSPTFNGVQGAQTVMPAGTTATEEHVSQTLGAAATAAPVAVEKSGDQLLIEMAKKLGISTQGKTRNDIQDEIVARASASPPPSTSPAPQEQPTEEASPPGTLMNQPEPTETGPQPQPAQA